MGRALAFGWPRVSGEGSRDELRWRVWLVKVGGLYVDAGGWLVGDPAKAEPFDNPRAAWTRARNVQRYWLGRARVVRRRHLRAAQW
jgi:hypothetical protein